MFRRVALDPVAEIEGFATNVGDTSLSSTLVDGEVRAWNVYHYYLGSKYFPELGYWELYDCTAQVMSPKELRDHKTIRELRTYGNKKVADARLDSAGGNHGWHCLRSCRPSVRRKVELRGSGLQAIALARWLARSASAR